MRDDAPPETSKPRTELIQAHPTHTMSICVNTRILSNHLTGVQRYLLSILEHLPEKIHRIEPTCSLHGVSGHAWEQLILPSLLHNETLWSPSHTGPIAVKRQVVTIHDLSTLDHPEWTSSQFAKWYGFLLPRLIRKASRIISVSHFTKTRIVDLIGIDPDKVSVIHSGVDERFRPTNTHVSPSLWIELQLPSPNYLLSVGSLEPRKNLPRLLKAWTLTQKEVPKNLWLVLTGSKGTPRIFKDAGIDRIPPRVHIMGHIPDNLLPSLYSGATGFVYPSLYEGFGLPPLEAMACGIPCAVSNQTSLPEIVGDAALQFDPVNIEAMANALITLINNSNLRMELRNKGLKRASLFSWNHCAQETWNVLKSI